MMFYDTFYQRLFDVHPVSYFPFNLSSLQLFAFFFHLKFPNVSYVMKMSRSMFKSGLKTQGKFLVKMISLCLSEITETAKFTKTLEKLTEAHNTRGVKSIECKFLPA